MFGKNKEGKLAKPKEIPNFVQKYLVEEKKLDAEIVPLFKMVCVKKADDEKVFSCRIFDECESGAVKVAVKDYSVLDAHPELILYEGSYDESTKKVDLKEKKRPTYDVPLLTQEEIVQKIEALKEPGSTAMFFQARGPAFGGPLGRGAAVVELNPTKGKKYNVYTIDVVGMETVGQKNKLFSGDKVKDVAKWVKESHHKRMY